MYARVTHWPRTYPARPPRPESTRPSVTICLTSRARLAPSAARTAISRSRAVARTSSRFATFMHASRSTSPAIAIPKNRTNGMASLTARIGIGRASGSGITRAPMPLSVSGYSVPSVLIRTSVAACASLRLTPGLSRANSWSGRAFRLWYSQRCTSGTSTP